MKKVFGRYKDWTLLIVPNWHRGRAVFFVVAPGPDPKVLFGDRANHESAMIAGRKVIRHEADNEQSSRSNR